MQVSPNELTAHLARGVAPLYLVSGDEPLQQGEVVDILRDAARAAGCEERQVFEVDRSFDWSALLAESASLSLFSARRLLELKLPSPRPGKVGGAALTELASRPGDDVCIVTMPAADGKVRSSAWFRAIDKAGVSIEVKAVPPAQLPRWIEQRFQARGARAQAEACALLAERTEGNMVASAQVVELLCLLAVDGTGAAEVTAEDVARASGDSARFDSFALVDAVLDGEIERAVRIVRGLRSEGAPLPPLVGSLAWMLRGLCTVAARTMRGDSVASALSDASMAVWRRRSSSIQRAMRRHRPELWLQFLSTAFHIDKASKGMAADDPWLLVEQLCVRICGGPDMGGR